MKIFPLRGQDSTAQMHVIPKAIIEEFGRVPMRGFLSAQYVAIEGPPISAGNRTIEPGIYRIHQATAYNLFAYKVMNLPAEEEQDENISKLYRSIERSEEGPSGDGDPSSPEELPKQNRRR